MRDFLEKLIPLNWDQINVQNRKMFLQGNLHTEAELVPREKVCAVEIWVECFGGDTKYMKRADSMEINSILSGLGGWERIKTPRRFGPYGPQKGFRRVATK